jgi:hypothetical protein
MILADEDAALFYRAWGALLTWVNDRRNVVPRFPRPTPGRPIDSELAVQIRDILWAEDALRDQFLAEAATELAAAERDLIASWKHRVHGNFILLKHLKKHSILMSEAVYGVRGIYTPLVAMFPYVPMFVDTVLLPFRDAIITDGLMRSPPMQISFGGGARRIFNEQYSAARNASQVRTRLPWQADPEFPITAALRSSGPGRAPRRAPRPKFV